MQMDIGTLVNGYSKNRDGDMNITNNFQVKEFACQDGSDPIQLNILIPVICQAVRNWFGEPFTPNSTYRNINHNSRVGGVPTSLHVYGNAVDIPARGCTVMELYEFLDKLLGDSCELFYYPKSGFVHVGVQNEKERGAGE